MGAVASNNNVRVIDRDAAAEVKNAAGEIRAAAEQIRLGNERIGIEAMREVSSMMGDLRWVSSNVGVEAARELRGSLADLGTVLNDASLGLSETVKFESRLLAESVIQATIVLKDGSAEIKAGLVGFGVEPVTILRDWLHGPVNILSVCLLASTFASFSPIAMNVLRGLEPYRTTVIKEVMSNLPVALGGFVLALIAVAAYVSTRSIWADIRIVSQQTRWILKRSSAVAAAPTIPTGFIAAFGGLEAPNGWLICDGAVLDVAHHPEYGPLARVLGNRFDLTQVNNVSVRGDANRLPDYRGRVGRGPTTEVAIGAYGGSTSVKLAVEHIPTHSHTIATAGSHRHAERLEYGAKGDGTYPPGGRYSQPTSAAEYAMHTMVGIMNTAGDHVHICGDTGNGKAFSVMNPYVCVNYIIKL